MVRLVVGCTAVGKVGDVVMLVSSVQSLVDWLRVPCRMGTSLWEMVAVVRSNVALQPWSQSWPMERRLPDASVRKRCTSWAGVGKLGMFRDALYLLSITFLLGNSTRMPSAVRCTLDNLGAEDSV